MDSQPNHAAIESALRYISADDRDIWVRVGMAIKSELGDDGYSLWDYWSQTGQTYNERDAQAVWRSFTSGSTKIATLFHIARQHGYQLDRTAPAGKPYPRKPPPEPQPDTSLYGKKLWLRATKTDQAVASHPYAINKGIRWAAGAGRTTVTGRVVGKDADCIVVAIRNIGTNKVEAVQCINANGKKQTFGNLSGNGIIIGNTLDKSLRWFVVEGWADAVSMVFHHYHGDCVAFASCGKSLMDSLAQTIADVYAPSDIIILEDGA